MRAVGVRLLIWAFWLSAIGQVGEETEGWIVMTTAEACQAARRDALDALGGRSKVFISGCHEMTPDELKLRERQPPPDTHPFVFPG